MQASELPRYRASGHTSLLFAPALVGAVALAIGLGWAYQALTGGGYVFLDLVEYVVFVIGVVAAVVAAGRLGKNRNRTLGAATGVAIAAAALAAAYYFDWRSHAPDASFGDFLDRRVAAGWVLGKRSAGQAGTLTGGWVWFFWTLEALVLGVLAIAFGTAFGPFCEACNRWMDVETVLRRDGLDEATVERVRHAQTIDGILDLPPAAPRGGARGPYTLVYKAHRCGRCSGEAYVTVTAERIIKVRREPFGMLDKPTSETLHVQVAVPEARLRAFAAQAGAA
ncbi:MAG TPA: hypothetical protein VHE35_25190 [Kofleriaceae bacterium]|nr:hypothetical protein [Kofleriaceae bacterium]